MQKNNLFNIQIIIILLFSSLTSLNAVTYEPLPNHPEGRDFWYYQDLRIYEHQILISSMPLEVMQGYILADSIIKTVPTFSYRGNPIDSLNLSSDTVQYLYKYGYILTDYDPVRFHSFTRTKCADCKNVKQAIRRELRAKTYKDPKCVYVVPEYILHIYVNSTFKIDTSNIEAYINTTNTIAYCKVLDTIKGKTFPSFNNAIFWNGETDGNNNYITKSIPSEAINESDFVFSYRDQGNKYPLGSSPLFDSNGDPGIKPYKEYIVFLEMYGYDATGSHDEPLGTEHTTYYSIQPFPGRGSGNMYPIDEDGNVIDEGNALGFGKIVPIETFKQNIRDKIFEIKNYGQ